LKEAVGAAVGASEGVDVVEGTGVGDAVGELVLLKDESFRAFV